MSKKIQIIILFTLLFCFSPANARDVNITVQETLGTFEIPGRKDLEAGLSGYFGGIQDNRLIIAGGSNFALDKPWDQGEKQIYDDIIIGIPSENGIKWQLSDTKLAGKLTDGASVSTPEGIVCSGGTGPDGISDKVFMLAFSQDEIIIKSLPSLPFPLKSHAMTVINNTVYLAGGETPAGPSKKTMALNLTSAGEGWQQVADMPQARTGMVLEAQSNGKETALYVIGGRLKKPEKKLTSFKATVWSFSPTHNTWTEKGLIQPEGFDEPLNIAVAAGAPAGASHIIIIGGDPGTLYNKIESAINRIPDYPEATKQRDSLWINHPGFNNHILVYNTITDKWIATEQWEGPAPVMAKMMPWQNMYVIPMGEISPAIRTSQIKALSISSDPVFGWINYLVLGLYFAGMLYLGFYFIKKDGDVDDYFKAGGRIPWWAAGISIFATTLSAITFISIPAKAYATDWHMLVFQLCIIFVAPIVIQFFLPFFRRFNLSTAYQYLELRFNSTLKWLASALFILFMVTRIAVVLYLPSLALNAVTGFDIFMSIILMGVVTIIYCTSGGIEAVVWGDVIQGIILMGGALVAFVFMITGIEGGISGFTEIVISHEKMKIFDFSLDISKPVFWVVLIGGLANTLILYTSDQSVVQRYMTTKDEKATGRSIWFNGIISIPVSITFFLLGTGLFAFYYSNPERLAATNPNIDSVFPQFIVGELPAGMAGLLISAIFAAAMSTISSNINSVSSVFTSDFYLSIAKNTTTKKTMMVARISSIGIGILGIGMALVLSTWSIESLWDQFNTFLGLLTSGIGALFLMGIFSKRISPQAALSGLLGGLAITLLAKQMTEVSFLLFGAIGLVSSLVIALLVSFVFPNKKNINGLTYQTLIGKKEK